jgi:hypothetical protein
MERINKLYFIIGLAIAYALFFEIAAYAGEFDEATTITFSEPVQVPGEVLPAGTYLFKLADNGNDPHIVQVLNADGTILYATLETIPTTRAQATGHTAVILAEQGSHTPDALVKWFYPGRLTGNEFQYPAQEQKNVAQDRMDTIVGNHNTTSSAVQAGE